MCGLSHHIELLMHKSVHKSSVPDSYTLLLVIESLTYLMFSVLMSDMYVCIDVCTKSTFKKPQQIPCMSAHTWQIKLILIKYISF